MSTVGSRRHITGVAYVTCLLIISTNFMSLGDALKILRENAGSLPIITPGQGHKPINSLSVAVGLRECDLHSNDCQLESKHS